MTPAAEELARKHFPLVQSVVTQVMRRSRPPANVDRDDLVSAAQMGLVQAAMSYDEASLKTFQGWAWIRMRGAVLDYMRSASPLSRGAAKRIAAGDVDEPQVIFVTIEEASRVQASEPMSDMLACRTMSAAVARLPLRLQNVVRWYFVDGLSLREIGRRLGVSEGRVSQLKADAIAALRNDLGRPN